MSITGFAGFLKRALKGQPEDFGKNPTHAGMLKAMGRLIERSRRTRPQKELELVGYEIHKRPTYAHGRPTRLQRRGAPGPLGFKGDRRVPVYYEPVEARGKYTGEKLREIRRTKR